MVIERDIKNLINTELIQKIGRLGDFLIIYYRNLAAKSGTESPKFMMGPIVKFLSICSQSIFQKTVFHRLN